MRKNCSCGHDESSHSTDGCTFAQCTCELFVSKVNKVTEKIASEISARQSLLANRIDPKKIIEMNSNKQENKLSNIKEKLDTSKFETKSENWDKIEKIKDEINDLQNDEFIIEDRKQEKILNLLGELLVLEPKDGKVWQIRGWILKAREDKSGAKLCFETALLYDRENISILDDLMIISMNLDLYDDALSYAKKILEIDPENTQALNSKAWIIMSKEGEENLKRASEIFEKIEKIDPNFVIQYQNHTWVLGALEEYEEMIKVAQRGLKYFPNDVILLHNLAQALGRENKINDQKECLKTLVKIESEPNAYYDLGKISEKNEEYENAIEYYKKGMEQDPDFFKWEFQFKIGYCYAMMKNSVLAIEYYKIAESKFVEETDKGSGLFGNMAIEYENLGNNDLARKYYNYVIEKYPNSNNMKNFGVFEKVHGEYENAIKYLTKASDLEARNRIDGEYEFVFTWPLWEVAADISECYEELGEYDKALEEIEKAITGIEKEISLTKDEGEILDKEMVLSENLTSKGKLLEKIGNYDDAIKIFEDAIKVNGANADAISEIGEILRIQKNDYEKSLELYERAYRIEQDVDYLLCQMHSIERISEKKDEDWLKEKSTKLLNTCENIIKKHELYDRDLGIIWYTKALCLRQLAKNEHDKKLVIECYEKAIQYNPEDTDFWEDKADIEIELERYQDVIYSATRAIELQTKDGQYTAPYFYKGRALKALGRFEDANNCFSELIDIQLEREIYYTDEYDNIMLNENFNDVTHDIEMEKSNLGLLFFDHGDCFLKRKKYYSAKRSYETLFQIDQDKEDFRKTHSNVGICCRWMALELREKNEKDEFGKTYNDYFEDAKRHYEQAIELRSAGDEEETLDIVNLAKLYWDMDDFPNAVKQCENALRINENDEDALWAAINCYTELGDSDKASEYKRRLKDLQDSK